MARRSVEEFEYARDRLAEGAGVSAIARELGIPRETVQRWKGREDPPLPALRQASGEAWTVVDGDRYCYLLGAYLGDGTVSYPGARCWTLRIVDDRRYEAISREILGAMRTTFPDSEPSLWPVPVSQADVLQIAHPAIPRTFPQHGPGRKHTRPIVLADWQRELTHAHPGALIRGLIHSDGCRSVNHVQTTLPSGRVADYHYVRYFFSNRSADIRTIFAEHCALLGVRATQSNARNLSVSRRDGVTIREEVVGPKR